MQEDSGHHVYILPFTDICQALSEILHMKLEMYFKEIILNTVDIKHKTNSREGLILS